MSSTSPWADLEKVCVKRNRCTICSRVLGEVPEDARPVVARLLADSTVPAATLARQIRARGVPISFESIVVHRAHLEAA